MNGGGGNDTFVFKTAAAADGDRIEGFQAGDKIDLRPLYGNLGLTDAAVDALGDATFNVAGGLKMHTVNGDTVIEGNTDSDADIDFTIIIAGHIVRSTDLV